MGFWEGLASLEEKRVGIGQEAGVRKWCFQQKTNAMNK